MIQKGIAAGTTHWFGGEFGLLEGYSTPRFLGKIQLDKDLRQNFDEKSVFQRTMSAKYAYEKG
jgi:hypothetical protein